MNLILNLTVTGDSKMLSLLMNHGADRNYRDADGEYTCMISGGQMMQIMDYQLVVVM